MRSDATGDFAATVLSRRADWPKQYRQTKVRTRIPDGCWHRVEFLLREDWSPEQIGLCWRSRGRYRCHLQVRSWKPPADCKHKRHPHQGMAQGCMNPETLPPQFMRVRSASPAATQGSDSRSSRTSSGPFHRLIQRCGLSCAGFGKVKKGAGENT